MLFALFSCKAEAEEAVTSGNFSVTDTVSVENVEENAEENTGNSDEVVVIPHFGTADSSCFPVPNERFKTWIEHDSIWTLFPMMNPVYVYLITHSDSTEARKVLETDEVWGVIDWEQSFSNGMKFRKVTHPEAGADMVLNTSCTSLSKVRNRILMLISEPDNSWSKDSSSYAPEGAGCHYNFQKIEDGTVEVSWYCGC